MDLAKPEYLPEVDAVTNHPGPSDVRQDFRAGYLPLGILMPVL